MPHYAHSLPGEPPEKWEPLEHHLRRVATLAGDFAEAFGARDWGHVAGLWHDLGKYSQAFRNCLEEARSLA
jgi:CRISPR-associated endonuclease/helicase Cas3